jgi:hypothetical protein
MVGSMRRTVLAGMLLLPALVGTEFPEAEISNGVVTAKLYLPDPEKGYYRGTRFDWSGQIYSLTANGHEYFGKWFEKYDPKLHDAIMGPVEEFGSAEGSPGYKEAEAGGLFVRIGVGAVLKRAEPSYDRFKTYDILDAGKWKVNRKRDSIEFVHELGDHNGYAYRYTKTIKLVAGKPEMVIEHRLRNTGKKRIDAWQYNHNFFVIDNKPTGPGAVVKFPFELKATRPFQPELATVKGNEIVYLKELQPGQSAFANFEGSSEPGAYDIRVEHKPAGAGVRIVGDRPISKIVYWSIRTTLCPEAYIDLSADPGKEARWTYTYTFYPVP